MSQKLYQQVGERVRTFRKLAKLTQEKLAEKADLSVHYLSRIETGSATPTLESLERIAIALNAPVGELFRPKEEQRERKALLQQIDRLLNDRNNQELQLLRNLILQIVELLPPTKRT